MFSISYLNFHFLLPAPSAGVYEQMKARSELCRNYATETEIASLRDPRCIISDDEGSRPPKKARSCTPAKKAVSPSDFICIESENSPATDSATLSVNQSIPRFCSQKVTVFVI